MENVIFVGLKSGLVVGVGHRRRVGELLAVQDVALLFGVSVSRVMYRMELGCLPPRIQIGESGDGRWYWTRADVELLRAGVMGRTPVKAKLPRCRLNDDDIKELLELRSIGISQRDLGVRFGLSQGQICRILQRLKMEMAMDMEMPTTSSPGVVGSEV